MTDFDRNDMDFVCARCGLDTMDCDCGCRHCGKFDCDCRELAEQARDERAHRRNHGPEV